jgi:hypothetical protein
MLKEYAVRTGKKHVYVTVNPKKDLKKLSITIFIALLCLACAVVILDQPVMPVKADSTPNVTVTFLIDYGNGTYHLARATIPDKSIDPGNVFEKVGTYASSFDALAAATSVLASNEGGGLGQFIFEINDVRMDGAWWWSFWLFQPNGTWDFSLFYASSIRAHDYSSIFAWRFTNGYNSRLLYPHEYPTTNITVSYSSASNSTEISGALTGIAQTWVASTGNWSTPSNVGLSGKTVILYSSPSGTEGWVQIGQATTESDGSYSFTCTHNELVANGNYELKAVFAGDSQYVGSSSQAALNGEMNMFPVPVEYLAGGLVAVVVCIAALVAFRAVRKRKIAANSLVKKP